MSGYCGKLFARASRASSDDDWEHESGGLLRQRCYIRVGTLLEATCTKQALKRPNAMRIDRFAEASGVILYSKGKARYAAVHTSPFIHVVSLELR